MEIGIAKYMSPNMALLVDTTDTVMNITGPILYAKTHDGDWEVRDSALEIIKTISHFAKSKILINSDFLMILSNFQKLIA